MCVRVYITYYQRNRDVILNRAKDYHEMIKRDYENRQEINIKTYLKKKKKKKKKKEYGKNRYRNIYFREKNRERKKKRLKEYQKIIKKVSI